jgi:predicted Zn-dependent protease
MHRKDFKQAAAWFSHIPQTDPLYLDARFRMGISSYLTGDYRTSKDCFHELSQDSPLNEVFNNLGASESRLNEPAALDDFKRAFDGDNSDPAYNFNYAIALYRQSRYDEAAQRLRFVLQKTGSDADATSLLGRCEHRTPPTGPRAWPAERLKENFDWNAFRQLKAVLQSAR